MFVNELSKALSKGKKIEKVELNGFVKNNRSSGGVGFIEFNDGTQFKNIQLVYNSSIKQFNEIEKLLLYTPIRVSGNVVLTPDNKQPFEISVINIEVLGTNVEEYPLQKKRHSLEYLREIAHLRPRTNTFQAVFRVRSLLSHALHLFFQERDFVYLHAPIITSNDAEGAGESFTVTTRADDKYEQDFFQKKAALTVSGQLNGEAFALAFNKIYTFGPTFRAEKSNTTRHASEFWMLEPEVAFIGLKENMKLIEDMLKYSIKYLFKHAPVEMKFFNDFYDKTLIERLTHVVNSKFKKLTYRKAISILKSAVDNGVAFQYNKIHFGMDLQSEHEKYLSEVICDGPVFITDYPKEIKAFYMLLNKDKRTVAACDLLVPKVGELVGGSEREVDYDRLLARMKELNIPVEQLNWYLELRRFGGVKHSGFGLGFDRLLMYVTAIENIKDVIPFPRTHNNLLF